MLEALELSGGVLAAAVGITTLAALLHGTLGFGFGLVSVSTLALLDPRLAPNPQLVVTLPLALFMAWRERPAIDRAGLAAIIVGAVPGTAAGAVIVRFGDQRTLDLVLGGAVLLAVVLLVAGWRVPRTRATLAGAGFASGAMGLISAIGGPPLALVYRDAGGATMRATLAGVFACGGVIAVATRAGVGALSVPDLWRGLAIAPGLALGLWLSRYTIARVEGAPLRVGVLVVAAVAGGSLMIRAALQG